MPIEVIDGFKVNRNVPVDTQRTVVATLEERNAINPAIRYDGMETRVLSTKTKYVLTGGITNDHWKPLLEEEMNALVSPLLVNSPTDDRQCVVFDQDVELSQPEYNSGISHLSLTGVFGKQKRVIDNFSLASEATVTVKEGIYKMEINSTAEFASVLLPRKKMGRRIFNQNSRGFNVTSSSTPSVSSIDVDYSGDPEHPVIWAVASAYDYLGTRTTDRLFMLNADGTPFRTDFGGFLNSYISKVKLTPDGSGAIVLGQFYNDRFKHICKLDKEGNQDPLFLNTVTGFYSSSGSPAAPNGFDVAPDGKVYVWGTSIASYEGTPFTGKLVRLNADGTFDNTFSFLGSSATNAPSVIAIQEDLKILVCYSSKNRINGSSESLFCVRLNPDGTTDPTFKSGLTELRFNGIVVLPDGKILVAGGQSTGINGASQIWRLHSDGTVDETFVTDFSLGPYPHNSNGGRLYPTPDGKILLSTNGADPLVHQEDVFSNSLFRINSDGSFDRSFRTAEIITSSNTKGTAYFMKPMRDGTFLLGGTFVKCNEMPKGGLIKLNYNGFNR
ncbi:putative delta-60 repeat protein [Marinilabilia salmonicolor]|jgi:uncharacterized delta-60 repeat protein|uniref:hypothetical protein n=1 Tax=Marinilabilia salmonicolor TaxID=989 RepID=UPI000D072D1F|nr:hypothetical protein [Marinilabilia salmonicolor]PRY97730.1 putative delta-60 repeat protein [Marinilabilia salmonicolor]